MKPRRLDRSIPTRLNLSVAMVIVLGVIGLLWLASRLPLVWAFPIGVIVSFMLLSNYALMHEATHDMLHPNPVVNDRFGMVLGWLFPLSFTVLKVTHTVHHCCNRTDHEMFDCFYPDDNRLVKYIQWYGLMFGLWWYLIPVGCLLLAVMPSWLHSPPFKQARTTEVLFDDFGKVEIRRLRLETVLGIVFWIILFVVLQLRWEAVLIAYAMFAFNWSTRQYVTHAFTPRNVRDGALNLRVSRPMGWLLLHGNWDRVHHQHPHLSWIHLPAIGRAEGYDTGYWHHYRRLWAGPCPCREPGPAILPRTIYREMA